MWGHYIQGSNSGWEEDLITPHQGNWLIYLKKVSENDWTMFKVESPSKTEIVGKNPGKSRNYKSKTEVFDLEFQFEADVMNKNHEKTRQPKLFIRIRGTF